MQKFQYVQGQDRIKHSRVTINENFQSVASNFSGDLFPTENLLVGMKCYRTDTGSTYTLKSTDPARWEEDTPEKLKNPHRIALSGKAKGKAAAFDGSADIAIEVTDVTADRCEGNSVTADLAEELRCHNLNPVNAPRHVWFSDDKSDQKRCADDAFVYNGVSKTLTVAKVDGWASRAGTADLASKADYVNNDIAAMRFHWNGQGGQPSWVWGGGSDPSNMYVYNPANFNVAHANAASSSDRASLALNIPVGDNGGNIWIQP